MITQAELKKLLHYDLDTGVVTWLKRPRHLFKTQKSFNTWNSRFSGNKAGNSVLTSDGKMYLQIGVYGKTMQLHRIIWLYVTGEWPEQVDHINGDGTDNRWCNLRNVDNLENGKNQRLPVNNSLRVAGVSWFKPIQKRFVYITIDGKRISLKYYDHLFEAVCARKSAEIKYRFHVNHGSIRPL